MSQLISQRPVLRRRPSYYGENLAAPLLEYLNTGKKNPDIEALLAANAELIQGTNVNAAVKTIRRLLVRAKLKPYFYVPMVQKGQRWSPAWKQNVRKMVLDNTRWVVEWEPASRRDLARTQAFTSCIELARQGLLQRIKPCARKGCAKRFFARFAHQQFCSSKCQRAEIRSTEEWKKSRREYMKRLRSEGKLRERHRLELSKRKGAS